MRHELPHVCMPLYNIHTRIGIRGKPVNAFGCKSPPVNVCSLLVRYVVLFELCVVTSRTETASVKFRLHVECDERNENRLMIMIRIKEVLK